MRKSYFVLPLMLLTFVSFAFNSSNVSAQIEEPTLSIPSIGVEAQITSAHIDTRLGTWDVSHLYMNVGHLIGTSFFGSGGNVVLAGHSETQNLEPDIFYNLGDVQVGELIMVTANGQQYQYIVTEVLSVSQFEIDVVYPTPFAQLTLITCQRDSYNTTSGEYQRRVVVKAVPA